MAARSRQKLDYYGLLHQDREQQLDVMAKALAAEQGSASGTKHATTSEEDYLYHWQDQLVTPDHLAQIAQQTAEKMGQETTDAGAPKWTTDQINQEIRAQQQRAVTPYRFTELIEKGHPDLEEQWAVAARLAKRHGEDGACQTCNPPAMPMAGDGQSMPAMAMGA